MIDDSGETGGIKPPKSFGSKLARGIWILFIALLIISFVLISLPGLLAMKQSPVEAKAIHTIRAYGEAQLAYSKLNKDEWYGSWQALREFGYIKQGYNRSDVLENYSVWTHIVSPSHLKEEYSTFGTSYYPPLFTIVAFPRTTSPPGYLSTFAMREDQVLRVYRPNTGSRLWGGEGDYGALTWEPIK